MKIFAFSLGLFVFLPLFPNPGIRAAEAVFSRDGSRVYLIDPEERPGQLLSIELATGQGQLAGVPDTGGEPIINLDRSNAGFLLCLTQSSLYAWDVEKGATARVCRSPEGDTFVELAYDPKTGLIAFVVRSEISEGHAEWQLWVLPKGADAPVKTRVRRVGAVSGPAFDAEGRLYFGTEGDLWRGTIEEIEPPDLPGGSLTAERYAPLASRETANTTPSQTGVSTVVAAGPWLYVHLRRMGGSGWGDVVRIKNPNSEDQTPADPAPLSWLAAYRDTLGTVAWLGENGTLAYLAASSDGKTVYFQAARDGGGGSHWLVRDHGEPEPLAVTEP